MAEAEWIIRLEDLITNASSDAGIVVVGLGNPLKGDDQVGSLIAKDLAKRFRRGSRIIIVDAEDSPENVIGVLSEKRPRLVVLIDSIDAGRDPGSINFLDLSETTYPFFGTHSIPLRVMFEMVPGIRKTILLGIQPLSCEIGAPLSKKVAEAQAAVAIGFGDLLEKMEG